MTSAVDHTFPASQALQLIALVRRWGITAAELLQDSGLDEPALELPHARLSLDVLQGLMKRARLLTDEPGLGIYLGLQKQASMYGYPGFAAMTAGTLRESISLAVRYTPVITSALGIALEEHEDVAIVVFDERVDMGSTHDIAAFSLLIGLLHMWRRSTGQLFEPLFVELPFAKPAYFPRFAHLLPPLQFDRPCMRIGFSRKLLDLPLLGADRGALSLLREAAERQLEELRVDQPLAERVRRLVVDAEGFRGIEEVARTLHLSTRTLKRRLAAEGFTFSGLLDEERRTRALALLARQELTVDDIVQRLGYSTSPNFVRAFRRWTGQTPAAYRKGSPVRA